MHPRTGQVAISELWQFYIIQHHSSFLSEYYDVMMELTFDLLI